MAHAGDDYGSFGSVPAAQPTGLGAPQLGVRANPEEAGAAIGRGISKVGEASENAANLYGGMVMETAANQAELSYIKASGDLKAKYSQYEGLQAEAMRPQYEADLQKVHQQFRDNLPLNAQRMFDSNTIRSVGYQTSEYASYAAGQLKSANLNSNEGLVNASVDKMGNLATVLDPTRFGEANGTIIHSVNSIADIKGWTSQATGIDKDTGKLTFGDDPQSQTTRAQYEQYLADRQSKLYLTAAKTITDNQGAAAAVDWAKAHWDQMPDAAKVAMNAYIAPKMKNETISRNIDDANKKLNGDWSAQFVSKVPSGPLGPVPQSSLEVIRANEGYTGHIGKDSNGYDVLNGINAKSFPNEFAEAKHILETQGKDAADKYTDNFYQKNIIDKYNINSLPKETQAIVADGLVNHGTGTFGQSLIAAAKNGASAEQLVDMRRAEYQRLATEDPAKYGAQLKGWNARLDKFGTEQGFGNTVYANKKDFIEANKQNYVDNAVNSYLEKYPDDHYGALIQERRATSEINKHISVEDGKLKADRDMITNAIGGSLTKGQPVGTYAELHALPGMAPVLDKVMREQGGFFGSIDTMINKASHKELSQNSPNGYDTILRTLQTRDYDHPNAISSNDHLAKGLGSSNPGESISWKDYQDAKPLLDMSQTSPMRDFLHKNMQSVAVANGNIDGKGQQRAVNWYNEVMDAYKRNQALGEKKLSDDDFVAKMQTVQTAPQVSRMQQIENWATSLFKNKQPDTVSVINPDGQPGTIPVANLEKALAAGYKKAQ